MSLDLILKGLQQTDTRFYEGIKKWLPLLEKTVYKICKITEQEPEDVFQDLLLALFKINKIYDVPLYRFKGHLYEKVCSDGSLICVRSTVDNQWFWTMQSNVEFVKKCEFSSLLGLRINQQCYNILKEKQKKRRGYSWTKTDKKVPKKFGGYVDNVWDVEKVISILEFDESLHSCALSRTNNPESLVSYGQVVSKIRSQLSPQTFNVFKILLEDPIAPNTHISAILGMPLEDVRAHRKYILRKAQSFRSFL